MLVLTGPTAAGKTAVSIHLARSLGGEIISADSMQIYREMRIGTARPSEEEMGGVPHHLMGFLPPDADFSVAQYQKLALAEADRLLAAGKLPIVVGGTGLYINSLICELDFSQTPGDPAFRARMEAVYEQKGPAYCHALLAEKDPAAAARIHPNDKKRLIRRLEVLTGEGESNFDFHRPSTAFDFFIVGVTRQRSSLYARINARVEQMMRDGLADEARALYDRYGSRINAFSAIGYKEFLPYFAGEVTLAETAADIAKNTRHFAKRQLTWFRREPRIRWYDAGDHAAPAALAETIASAYRQHLQEGK